MTFTGSSKGARFRIIKSVSLRFGTYVTGFTRGDGRIASSGIAKDQRGFKVNYLASKEFDQFKRSASENALGKKATYNIFSAKSDPTQLDFA